MRRKSAERAGATTYRGARTFAARIVSPLAIILRCRPWVLAVRTRISIRCYITSIYIAVSCSVVSRIRAKVSSYAVCITYIYGITRNWAWWQQYRYYIAKAFEGKRRETRRTKLMFWCMGRDICVIPAVRSQISAIFIAQILKDFVRS